MRKRILKAMAIVTPIAVFCSLQFGSPHGGPVSSVLDPLLPAPAAAGNYWCGNNHYCPSGGGGACQQWGWPTYCQHDGPPFTCQNVPQC